MFLLVPAHLGSPRQRAVKLLLLLCSYVLTLLVGRVNERIYDPTEALYRLYGEIHS